MKPWKVQIWRKEPIMGELAYWLVEEVHGSSESWFEPQTIPHRVVVVADTPQDAFVTAELALFGMDAANMSWNDDKQTSFVFSEVELGEALEGYLWQAGDGSAVWYDVRKLPMPAIAKPNTDIEHFRKLRKASGTDESELDQDEDELEAAGEEPPTLQRPIDY